MKKLSQKGTVHPSSPTISDQFSFLPATVFKLTLALSPEDKEVLAYLIPCSRRTIKAVILTGDHPPLFHYRCFGCYLSYWVRWDSSPNHQLISEIINAFEDSLARNKRHSNPSELKRSEFSMSSPDNSYVVSESVGDSTNSNSNSNSNSGGVKDEEEKGFVRRCVSFIGEKILGCFQINLEHKKRSSLV